MSRYDLTPVPDEQPRNKPFGTSIPQFRAGSQRSVGRLKYLKFDPIGELVKKYRELDGELDRQRQIRSGDIVELTPYGKVRNFNPNIMTSIYEQQIGIAEKLLRYRYGRVPEGEIIQKPTSPLVVNLTKKGETYVVNETADEPVMDIDTFEEDYDQDADA